MREKLRETVAFLRERLPHESVEVGIILGTGLGGVADAIEDAVRIPYAEIPHFPVSTVKGHEGALIVGTLSGKRVIAQKGRFHYYEGYSAAEVAYPVRVMGMLGARVLIVSNAAGGVNPGFRPGDIMLIRDHIHLIPDNPLRGPNLDELGPRFPSMHNAYDRELRLLAHRVASRMGIPLKEGVYVSLPGPNLETPAEYLFSRAIGGDANGMSTTPEVIAAVHQGMRVLGFSVITNVANPYDPRPATHEEVLEVAEQTEPRLSALVKEILKELAL